MMEAVIVEFLGTLVFLYVILATGHFAAIGATLALMIYLGGPISGGNYNPAVTVMLVMAKKQKMDTLLPYILAQVAGGIVALQLFNVMKE
jgi:glycerol uptake facilitator-like aquaporin